MTTKPGIYHRGEIAYDQIEAVNISRLVWIHKSPKHYLHAPNQTTKPMSLGTAAHSATLELSRFVRDFAVWDVKSESGNASPRNPKNSKWIEFQSANAGKTIITEDERDAALEISQAVRGDRECAKILERGKAEVSIVWKHKRTGILCKGRVDWLAMERTAKLFADLKTAADITPGVFFSKAAKLHYHERMAWYHDGIRTVYDMPESEQLETLIMAVESGNPHDSAVYTMDEEVLEIGRVEYELLMDKLQIALDTDTYPGIANGARMPFVLPRWAVDDPEDSDVSDIDWKAA